MRLLPPAAFAAFGSLVALVPSPPESPAPTYSREVAPLLLARCVGCHRADGPAPFSLSTYGQAKRWSAMSLRLADNRRMPPWKPTDKGVFHDENRLSSAEIDLLRAWDKAGSPEGVPQGAPSAPSAPAPEATDAVLRPPKPFVVSAGAPDEYRYFVVENPYAETKWLRGTDLRPSNTHVVHHMTAFLDGSGEAARMSAANGDGQAGYASKNGGRFRPSAILGFWAPGMRNRAMPEGTAMELPPKARIVVQVHYVSTGRAEADRWSLGLRLADAPPRRAMVTSLVEGHRLEIPAGEAAYQAVEEQPVPSDTTVWAVMPHAHALARRMVAEAILPDGARRPLITIGDWDPAWQSMYWFKEAVRLPKGSRVRFTVTYDNSEANPRNPHLPPRAVHWGEGSQDEMLLLALLTTRD